MTPEQRKRVEDMARLCEILGNAVELDDGITLSDEERADHKADAVALHAFLEAYDQLLLERSRWGERR